MLFERAVHEIPTKSLSEIQQHTQWYTEYSTLLDNKKKAIVTWRRQRQVWICAIAYYLSITRCLIQKSKHEDVKPDKDLLDTKMQSKQSEVLAKEREERFARLSAWKVSWCFHTKLLRSIFFFTYFYCYYWSSKAQQEKNRTKLEEEKLRAELDHKKAMEKEKRRRVSLASYPGFVRPGYKG